MKILNNRYRIIKELPAELKNDRSFIVEDLNSNSGKKLELRTVYTSALDDDVMDFIRQKFLMIKQLKESCHIKNHEFTRLSNIDDKKIDEDIYLYTTDYIEEKEPILDFLPNAKPSEILKLFLLMLKELNYLITYGIVYNSFNLNNIYVIKKNEKIDITAKDFVTEKIQYSKQITLLENEEIHAFHYGTDIIKSIILSLLLKKNILKNHERYFEDLQDFKIIHSDEEKDIYNCFFKIYNEINEYNNKNNNYSFYEILSQINLSLNSDYNISTPLNIITDSYFPIKRAKEKKEILSVFKKKKTVKNKNFIINAQFGMGKTCFLSEIYFLLLLEKADVYYIPSLGDTDDIKFILHLMKNLFLKNPLIQKKHEKEIKNIFNSLKQETENNGDIKKISSLKYKLINLISGLIIEGAASNFIVFIIDDIHLISEFITKSFLYIITENLDKKNIILIQSANEILINNNTHAQKFIKTLSSQSGIRKINLQNLSEDETETLIRNTVNIKNIPEILLKKIYLHTAGHPLFINGALKELITSGELSKDKTTELCKISANLSNPAKQIPISKNIEQEVKKQVKDLTNEEVSFLKDLCIFTSSFKVEFLPKVLDIKTSRIEKYLSKFLDLNIIKKISKSNSDEYSIINKILQKALYNELDHDYKVELHKKILKNIKTIKNINIYEFIWHAEKSELTEEVINYCIKNKDKIKKQYTHMAYISIFEKIYNFISDKNTNQRLDILLTLAELYLENEDIAECNKKIETIEEIIKNYDSNKKAIARLNIIKTIQGMELNFDIKKIKKSLNLAEKFAPQAHDLNTQLWLDTTKAMFLKHSKKYTEAIEEAKKVIVKCGNSKEFAAIKIKVLLELGNSLFHSNKYKEAEKAYREALKAAKKTGNINIEDAVLNNLAVIQERVYKDFSTTISYYAKILKNNTASGNTSLQILALINSSITYSYLYDYENAYKFCNQAIKKITQNLNKDKIFFAYVFMHDIVLSLCMYDKVIELEKQIAEILKNKNILKTNIHLCGYKQTKNTFHYAMGDFSFENIPIKEDINEKNEIIEILTALSLFASELNKLAQNKTSSTEKAEEYLLKLTMNPVFKDNIYLVFYELVFLVRKIIIFRCDLDFKKIVKTTLKIKPNSNQSLIKAPILFLESYLDFTNSEKKLLEAASLIDNKYMLDLSIDINIQLGFMYLKKNNINIAMVNFVEAQELINVFIKKIPDKFRKSYFNIHSYGLPSIIIDDYINKKIKPSYKLTINDFSYEQIKKILSKNTVEKLKNNSIFIMNIIAQAKSKTIFKNKSIDDVIAKFSNDFIQNIKSLLNFAAINLLAESSDVFITTNDNKIESLFNFGQNKTIERIANLIESSTYREENLFKDGHTLEHLVIPINYHGNNQMINTTTGYLVFVSNKAVNNFGNLGIGFCLNIENIFAFLIESYKAQQEAATDKLTSALTRKYSEAAVKDLLHISKSSNRSFAILMYDLDRFKRINDKFGHQIGDTVLKATAKAASTVLKKDQILGRVGGEEFIILLPDAEEVQALNIAEKIRKQVEALNFEDPAVKITVSIGVALFPKHGNTEKELISKVDQALYAAKNSGRNKITLWKEELAPAENKADKLAGILTGNTINDTKNILSFIDTVSLIRHSIPKTEKLKICLEKIVDSTGADAGIFVCPVTSKTSKRIFKYEPVKKAKFPINSQLLVQAIKDKEGFYKIDWENIVGKNEVTGIPNWNSTLLVPVILQEEIKAIIYLVSEIRKKKFGMEDLNLVNLFAGLIAPFF